jgi:collagenase-like PrtC family protease
LDFTTCNNKHIKHLNKNEFDTPYCAACQLKQLSGMGINSYKIAGRGYPVDLIVKAITFLRSCLAHEDCSLSDIKANYKSIFGTGCHERFCYYH